MSGTAVSASEELTGWPVRQLQPGLTFAFVLAVLQLAVEQPVVPSAAVLLLPVLFAGGGLLLPQLDVVLVPSSTLLILPKPGLVATKYPRIVMWLPATHQSPCPGQAGR